MKLRRYLTAVAFSMVACGAPDDDPRPEPVTETHP